MVKTEKLVLLVGVIDDKKLGNTEARVRMKAVRAYLTNQLQESDVSVFDSNRPMVCVYALERGGGGH